MGSGGGRVWWFSFGSSGGPTSGRLSYSLKSMIGPFKKHEKHLVRIVAVVGPAVNLVKEAIWDGLGRIRMVERAVFAVPGCGGNRIASLLLFYKERFLVTKRDCAASNTQLRIRPGV